MAERLKIFFGTTIPNLECVWISFGAGFGRGLLVWKLEGCGDWLGRRDPNGELLWEDAGDAE